MCLSKSGFYDPQSIRTVKLYCSNLHLKNERGGFQRLSSIWISSGAHLQFFGWIDLKSREFAPFSNSKQLLSGKSRSCESEVIWSLSRSSSPYLGSHAHFFYSSSSWVISILFLLDFFLQRLQTHETILCLTSSMKGTVTYSMNNNYYQVPGTGLSIVHAWWISHDSSCPHVVYNTMGATGIKQINIWLQIVLCSMK